MHKVLILGAGKIGPLISGLLAESGDYEVHVADVSTGLARAVVDALPPRSPARPRLRRSCRRRGIALAAPKHRVLTSFITGRERPAPRSSDG